ncbi:MAG: dipeptide epimerase [Pseudomonadota bacterium]
MKITTQKRCFPLKEPLKITGHTFVSTDTIWVRLEQDGYVGQGEAIGVYFIGESVASMIADVEEAKRTLPMDFDFGDLAERLPPGGARNALDCALWDLRCKQAGKRIWDLLACSSAPVKTVFTISVDTPEIMAGKASAAPPVGCLKLKLNDAQPVTCVEAVRAALPGTDIVIDANQGWSAEQLKDWAPALDRLGVSMIEQPLKRGDDADLAGYHPPVPLAADESCLDRRDFEAIGQYYDIINIKLDKTGGLSEGLSLAQAAKKAGKDVMIGCMSGSSLSMAPAFVIAQSCKYVDIDGPLLITQDVAHAMTFGADGTVSPPDASLWG